MGSLAAVPGVNVKRLRERAIDPKLIITHFEYLMNFPNLSEDDVIEQVSIIINHEKEPPYSIQTFLESIRARYPKILTEEKIVELMSGVTL